MAQNFARLSHTGWDELKTRGGQEFHKRLDLAQYRAGLQHPSDGLAAPGSLGTFFLSPHEIHGRVNLLKTNLPRKLKSFSVKPTTYAATGSPSWDTRILIMVHRLIGISTLCTENVRPLNLGSKSIFLILTKSVTTKSSGS